ncbi:hypothetical protein ACFW04_014196 [Cataglyphis niger]
MADGQRYVQHYDKNWENNFFAFIHNKTICLLCGYKPSHVKKFLIERHYKNKHSNEYAKYNGEEKINLIECLIKAVKSFGNSLTLAEAASIQLNKKTVAAKVTHIASSIEEKLKYLLATCLYFLCFDESINNRHVSQLSIFARIVQNDFSYIFKAVEQTLQKFNIDFSKCSAIVTDGAKAMTAKFKIPPYFYYIIHQEALWESNYVPQIVTKIINVIKGGHKFLNHRKFQSFLEEHNAIYKDIPLHSEVRWLSAGKCLEKFFAIRKEIFLFLQEMSINYNEFKSFSEDLDFLSELAVITDLTSHLSNLNLKLQKTNQTIAELVSHIDSFRRKLLLFKNHLGKYSFHFYPSCQTLFEEYGKD